MKKQILYMATVLALAVSNSASADLVDVNWQLSPYQHPDGLHTTFQLYASFNNAGDQIAAVSGKPGPDVNIIAFWTFDSSEDPGSGGDLYNQELYDGLPFNDFPSAPGLGGELWDTYVTIGQTTFPSNTLFTPNFLCCDYPPNIMLIYGSQFYSGDGAWFFFGAPPVVGDLPDAVKGNETFDIVIAQFTVDAGSNVHLSGNIAWLDALSGSSNTPFEVNTPAPGALALLGLAGLVGIRRRRW
ncbi:MAG: hypothetical protein IH984_13350 [Planctomycetes bacterium]|nr:hypothetical protein [Planctomycetota bacterium]